MAEEAIAKARAIAAKLSGIIIHDVDSLIFST
jgi:hypothetical protein